MTLQGLIDFWSELGPSTVHPHDRRFIESKREFVTSLVPLPWVGPLMSAKVFLLLLNPGMSEEDENYERSNPGFAKALRENLTTGSMPYPYLDQRFDGHPGNEWARETFGADFRDPAHLASVCVIQLVPYHSWKGAVARKLASRLPSSGVARRFAKENLVPRAASGEISLIVGRSQRLWDIHHEHERIVVYRGWECRRAFQTANSRGGKLLRAALA